MKNFALVGCLVSFVAFAGEPAMTESMGWTPRKVTKEDKKGVTTAVEAWQNAWMTGDMNAAVAMVDFPSMMATDDKDGNVMVHTADAAAWQKMMTEPMAQRAAQKDAKMAKMPAPKVEMFFLTDNMVMVTKKTMKMMGTEKIEARSAMMMVNKGGKWMVKGEFAGGWTGMAKYMMGMSMMTKGTMPGMK